MSNRGSPGTRGFCQIPAGLLVFGALLWPGLAQAEPKDDARRHFLAGLQAAQAKQYEIALEEFLAAQDAWPHPNTLYNIARAYTDLGQLDRAVAYYRLFQEAAPDKAGDVLGVIAVLEARQRQSAPAEPAVAPPGAGALTSSAELARLQALAVELAALSETLARRGPAATPPAEPAAPPEGPPPDSTVATGADPAEAASEALPEELPLMSDAYERVVVTASRYGQDPLDSPSTITVITQEEIRLSGATNLPDLLRRVAGVDVMSLAAGEPNLSIRGFNRELSNKVLVLIDGRSVYLDFLGTVLWSAMPIGLHEIERIEVIRGPGSAIYGANAVTGVINILTRRPGAEGNVLSAEGGAPGYVQADALFSGESGPALWRFSGGYHQVNRWSRLATVAEGGTVTSWTDDQDTSVSMIRADGRVDLPFASRGLASVSGGYSGGRDEFYALGVLGNYGMDQESSYARADLAFEPVHLRVFHNRFDGYTSPWLTDVGSLDLGTDVESTTTDAEAEYLGDFKTGKVEHRLNFGLSYRYKTATWAYLDPDSIAEHHAAAFVQEQARIGRVQLVGSLRADRHPLVDIDKTLSPRAAAILRIAPNTSVRASAGTAFRSPAFLESYLALQLPSDVAGVHIVSTGSTSLLPERIFTGELGVHDESTSLHTADAAIYVNRVAGLIALGSVEPAIESLDAETGGFVAGYTRFGNQDTLYTALGAEAEGRLFPADGLDIYLNGTWERIIEQDGQTIQADLSTSEWKFNLGSTYRTPWRVDVGAHLHYVSPQVWRLREFDAEGQVINPEEAVQGRVIVAGRLGLRLLEDESLEVAATVWNPAGFVESGRFREHPKGQLVGGRAYGSATWRF